MSASIWTPAPPHTERGVKNTKAKGRRQEYRSMALLEAAGYRCTRSAASLGAFDLVGVGATGFVLCQVKSNRWPDPAEMETLREFPCPANCVKLVHRWRDRRKLPDVKEL